MKKIMAGPTRTALGTPHMRAPYRRPTGDEKAALEAEFDKLRARNHSIESIANQLHFSTSTAYRWNKNRCKIAEESRVVPVNTSHEIDKAINVLCNPGFYGRDEKLTSIFFFISWLRWPKSPANIALAMPVCLASYFQQQNPHARFVADLGGDDQKVLAKQLRLKSLGELYSLNAPTRLPQWYDIFDRQDPRLFSADVVSAILKASRSSQKKRPGVLSRAFQMTNKHMACSTRMVSTRRTFDELWQEYSAAAPFHYVEAYHSKLMWWLHPSSEGFAADVDFILRESKKVRLFFEKSLWTRQEISRNLGEEVSGKIDFPAFPTNLAPSVLVEPQLSNEKKLRLIKWATHVS